MKNYYLLFILFCFKVSAQTFSGTGGTIPDNEQTIEFTLNVNGLSQQTLNQSFGVKEVCINIAHPYVSDLNVLLVSPDGTTTNLFSGIGGNGNNFQNTCFSQTALNSINTGTAPFSGQFKPQENIGNHNNTQNGNGIWKLRITDTYPQDQGSLTNWSLTFGNDAPVPFVFTSSNLPIVLINTNGQTIQDEPSIVATMKIIDNGPNMNYITDTPNQYNGKINIEYRGNYSQTLPQKPYKIETLDAQEAEQDVSIFGFPEEHDWCLLAMYNDKAFVRNQLAYNLFDEMGHYASRNKHCEVVLNGTYMGVFLFCEKIKRDNNRVDIAKLEPNENSGINLTGGYIVKNDFGDGWQLSHTPIDHPEMAVTLAYEYPKAEDITVEQKAYIQNFINQFETALYSQNYADATVGYQKYIDVTSFLDYFIVNELSRNNDGFKKSSYFHKDKDSNSTQSKLVAGPVWDFDWAWKNIDECPMLSVTDGSGWAHLINDCGPDNPSVGWYVRLLQDTNFQNKLRCRWENLRQTILNIENINNYVDTTALYLQQAQQRQFDRWGNLGMNTGSPEVDADPNTFEGQMTRFKNWIATRIAWLDANIPGSLETCNLNTAELPSYNWVTAYPNPVNDKIHFSTNTQNFINRVYITDSFGKVVMDQKLFSTHQTIQTSSWSLGVYFCKLTNQNGQEKTIKLLVTH